MVHITDGDPTWHVRLDGSSTGMGTPEEHLRHAAVPADRIKAAGAHIYAVGVGPAADNVDALVATSGPDVYDQSDLADILDRVKRGTFDVNLEHRRLETTINRLVLGILAAALFVGSAQLWSRAAPPVIAGVSVFGALGYALAAFLGYRLLVAIKRSGDIGIKR